MPLKHSEVYSPFPNPIVLLTHPAEPLFDGDPNSKFLVKLYFHIRQIARSLTPGRSEIFRVSSGRCNETLAGFVSSLHGPPEGNQIDCKFKL
jgi:hypothetical protein